MENILALKEVLNAAGAVDHGEHSGTWLARSGWLQDLRFRARWDTRQERILGALFEAWPGRWFVTAEDLPEEGWESAAEKTCRLPGNVDAWGFLNTPAIIQGSWALYAAPSPCPVGELGDPFRTPASAVHDWLRKHGVAVLIVSWYDDVEWKIFRGAGPAT